MARVDVCARRLSLCVVCVCVPLPSGFIIAALRSCVSLVACRLSIFHSIIAALRFGSSTCARYVRDVWCRPEHRGGEDGRRRAYWSGVGPKK